MSYCAGHSAKCGANHYAGGKASQHRGGDDCCANAQEHTMQYSITIVSLNVIERTGAEFRMFVAEETATREVFFAAGAKSI